MGMRISDFFPLPELQSLHEWLHYSTLIRLAGNSFIHTCAGRFAISVLTMSRLRDLGQLHKRRSGNAGPTIAPETLAL